MDPKVIEYFQFCDHAFAHDPYRYNLFIHEDIQIYVVPSNARTKEKGNSHQQRVIRQQGIHFDPAEYGNVIAKFKADRMEYRQLPLPNKPTGPSTFGQYKAVFRKIYKVQMAQNVLATYWDKLWLEPLDELAAHVKERVPLSKKKNYAEKVDGEFALYMIVEHYNDIEQILWDDSHAAGPQSVNRGLRHRYCFEQTTTGLLCSETMHRSEFSDHLGFNVPKQDTDVHDIWLMISQVGIGKTTHGRKQYGRSMRHRDVRLCAPGGFSFYMEHRFLHTSEFADMTVKDWCDNEKWFDIKILADIASIDKTKEMRSDTYGKHVKKVLDRLGLSCNKLLHLGRNMGSRILELLEEEHDEILNMGQWSKGVHQRSYSTKLPMAPIRKLAGYKGSCKFHFNPRTAVEPPEDLLLTTPIGKWCYRALDEVLEASTAGENQTAILTLRFFCDMNRVFLQDAAAMMVLHPERESHPLFHEIALFSSESFKVRRFSVKLIEMSQ